MIVGIQDEILRLHTMGRLNDLLADKTTRGNIIWATDAYRARGDAYRRDEEMLPSLMTGAQSDVIKTRARKAMEEQSARTRKHAEVFTPPGICKTMVGYADAAYFGGDDPFLETAHISFPKRRKWQHYVDARRLEITCGEAPYLVQRYDVSTGEVIPPEERHGILDRKLRIVNEHTEDEDEWMRWGLRAFQATYGYEFQGDNLLIARVNLLMTFEEYLYARWKRKPNEREYRVFIKTIVWNLWQMDGLTGMIPYAASAGYILQGGLFDPPDAAVCKNLQPYCRIYDWRRVNSLEYRRANTGGRNMKFDFVIGNPPYQDETIGDNKGFAPPIYHEFMDASYEVANVVELIHPARFLFNAGSTPKAWNQKMLSDVHFKILHYEADSSNFFESTDIKGGVVISYRDSAKKFGSIGTFTAYEQLNKILEKVRCTETTSLTTIILTSYAYHFTEQLYIDFPELKDRLSRGHAYDLKSNVFTKLGEVFFDQEPQDSNQYIYILGRENNGRVYKYIRRDYINKVRNLDKYKVFLPKANGTGRLGEVLSCPIIAVPGVGATETFLSLGSFDTESETISLLKYIKTKFARGLLGVLKTTQNTTPDTWKYVPLQDFTSSSDINWSVSVAEIDRQLYAKYGLTEEEIAFIESHVEEMA